MNETIKFTEESVKNYLDRAIEHWREEGAIYAETEENRTMARHYIDAYQSVRTSLFGELLE